MPLLPALQSVVDAIAAAPPPPEGAPPAEARAHVHAMMETTYLPLYAEHPPVASEDDRVVPVEGDTIGVRVYRTDDAERRPGHLYLHGGGFWLGTLEHSDSICRALATDTGSVVVSVDYRLAPEHTFPTAAEDCYAALLWVVDHAAELGIDTDRLSVGGGSAGGNLAAVVALMARDRGGPPLVLQVLEVPVTDFTGPKQYAHLYLADPSDATNPYASPLLAADLTGLPPAVVMCAEYDALKDEGMAYAERLAAAGVAVEARCWEGQFHGSQTMAKVIPDEAAEYHRIVVAALRRAYDSP